MNKELGSRDETHSLAIPCHVGMGFICGLTILSFSILFFSHSLFEISFVFLHPTPFTYPILLSLETQWTAEHLLRNLHRMW